MKCRIVLIALLSVLSICSAISVDYYPHNHPHAHHPHDHHVKYIEPAHAVKYVQPVHAAPVAPTHLAPAAPIYKTAHVAPVKYAHHHDPHAVKYVQSPHLVKHVEYDEPAHYEYGYDVHDPHTGDVKSHTEKRDGHSVHGRYEVLDPDGFKRIVEYTADEHNGFNAVVTRVPSDVKIQPDVYKPHPVPVAQAPVKIFTPQPAPILKYAEPVAPIVKQYVSPVVKQLPQPAYYAPPEHPKFFKPIQKVAKYVKPAYEYEPHHHPDVKYVQPAPHYTHY